MEIHVIDDYIFMKFSSSPGLSFTELHTVLELPHLKVHSKVV